MVAIFHDIIHDYMEDYIDDIILKSQKAIDHLLQLRKVFEGRLRYKLRMNPLKCAFRVSSSKFHGFVVHKKGIDVVPSKIEAICAM